MSPISPCAGLISHALAMQQQCNSPREECREHASTVQLQCKRAPSGYAGALNFYRRCLGFPGDGNHPHDARHAGLRRNKIVPGYSSDLRPRVARSKLI